MEVLIKLESLSVAEMKEVNGGTVAYDIGYAVGDAVGDFLILYGIYSLIVL